MKREIAKSRPESRPRPRHRRDFGLEKKKSRQVNDSNSTLCYHSKVFAIYFLRKARNKNCEKHYILYIVKSTRTDQTDWAVEKHLQPQIW